MTGRKGVSVIEVMIALTILSTLVLPGFMFIVEYTRGGSDMGDRFEVLNRIEEKLETVLAMPFNDIPEGKTTDVVITSANGRKLDLKPVTIANKNVTFECEAETLSVDFAAMKDYSTRQLQRATVENGMKRVTITARWGKGKREQNMFLMVYKANL